MSTSKLLDTLRSEIDVIDNSIHDLLMRRIKVVEKVRDFKQGQKVKITPHREAEILYRLISRHQGPFPKRELVRMWRELIVATLTFEGAFSVAVCLDEDGEGYWDLARDQYGSFTPMSAQASVRRVIEAVRGQEATVGILPLPRRDDDDPWWRHLVTESDDAPKIIARVPFAGPGNNRGTDLGALVICPVAQEPTNRDHSFLAIEMDDEIGLDRLGSTLAQAGLPPSLTAAWHEGRAGDPWLYLAEISVFTAKGDRRAARFLDGLGLPVKRLVWLGGFAIPLTADELVTAAEQ